MFVSTPLHPPNACIGEGSCGVLSREEEKVGVLKKMLFESCCTAFHLSMTMRNE